MKRVLEKEEDPTTGKTVKVDKGEAMIKDFYLVEQDAHLLSPDKKAMERFTLLDDPRFIVVSGKRSHPDTVEFSRYQLAASEAPLVYTVGKKSITTSLFPDFELAPYGIWPGSRDPALGAQPLPPTFDVFHLLRKEGEERVLVPFCQSKQEISVSGNPLRTSLPVFSESYDKIPVYEYKVDPETNRLVAQSGDAYAYLAYICLTHSDYASAAFYLDRAKTSAGYSERYDQIFEWFEKWDDDSPNGVALKLRFELLRENVFIERAARAIAEGSSKSLGEANLEEVNRLISLAELFAKYKEHSDAVEMGEDGRSPALDLTPEQEEDLARYVRQLIDTHGEEPVKTDEPRPVSAQMAPLQEFMLRDEKHNALNISNGAMALWLFKGSGKHKTPLVVHDPTWVLRDFRDTFNKLLEREPNSVEFKGLVNKLRMISEFTPEELDPVVKKQVEAAQAYLLKLASAKMNDAVFITQLKETVLAESQGRFPEIQGPWFFNRRSNFLNLLNSMTRGEKTHFDQFSLASKDRSRTKALDIYHDHDRSSAERKIAKRAIRFLNRPDLPDDGPEFNQAFRSFLLEEILGGSGARSLLKIDEILGELEEYEIEQPQQTQELPKLKPKPPEQTYREKYGPLLESLEHYVDHTKIESMEALISKRSESPKLARITTPDNEKKAIFQDRLDEYEEMFTVSEKKPATVSESIFDGLASSEIKAYQRMAEEHRSDLHAHLEGTVHAVDISWSDAEKLHEELEQQLLLKKSEKEHLRRRLLQYVEHFEKPVGTLALKRLTGAEVKPSLEVLIALWRQNEIMQEWSENPLKGLGLKEMTPQVIEGLDEMISQYMQLDAKTRHLERTVDVCAGYLESCAAPPEGAGEPQLARELWDALQTRRHFNLNDADARDLLFLEYSLGIILRPQQVETLRDMLSDPNAVRQLIMGGGKSKVLLPMLAKRKANGKNLVMLMLPEELYETNCRDLDATNRLLFRQGMHRFDFSRHSERSEESLLKAYGMLLETVRDRGYVMTTKRSVLSFKNAYIELLYKLQRLPDEDEELPKLIAEVRAMSKILKLFQAQTDVIADEVDSCLDVRKEVNFSLGDPEPVDPIKGDTGAELMSIILEAKPGGPLFKLRENLLKNTQAAISPEERKITLRHLASAFYEKHRVELINFEKDLFIDYLMDSAADREVQDRVLSMKGSEKEDDVVLYRQITTVKAYLDRGFGTALGRIGNVNYGRDPVSGIWTIPYKASNSPHIGSEFDDDIERLTFTYQDYLQNGVEYKQVYQSVARMLKQAQIEMRSREEEELITLNETAGGKEFQEFLKKVDPTEKLGALTLSQAAHPKRIEAIVAAVNATPEGRLAFCHTQVIENIKQYDAQIHSNSQDLVEMVRSFGGFTGTPWNRHTYHDKIDAQKSLGVDGQTWELMLGRDVPVRSFAFDADRPIESLVTGLEVVGNYQAVIDTGAYLRGVDNDEFIDYCLDVAEEDGIEMGGGIYFDRSGKIVKKCGLDEKSLAIEIAPETEKMSNITLYDQGHTVGADIKQGKTATAIVTVGENTFIRDLFQAVWRLRQLHQEQRVELAISDEIKFRILAEKPEERDSDIITSEDILRFCLQNEARREAEDNYRAEKEKIQGIAKRHGFNEIVAIAEADTNGGKIIALARELATPDAGFFIKTRPKEKAYEEYGRLKILEDPVEVLARLRGVAADRCLLLSAKLESISLEASERSKQKGVEVTAREDRPVDWVPNDVDGSVDSVGGEVEQEAQAEVENTLELMLETETVKELEVASEVVIPMVKSGAAGHGDVYPLELGSINHAVDGAQAGDRLRRLRNGSPYFDEDIFLSAVFERNLPSVLQPFTLPRSLFYSNRKSVKNVLIVKKEGRWTMIIPTMHEAHHSCREFIGGADEGTQAVEVAISKSRPQIVYKTGEERTEELPFEDLEDRAQFYRLYVQAKLFNGEIVYETAEEIEALKAWLKEVDVIRFAEYFQNYIISAKPRRFADEYPKSSLYRIIQEVSSELMTV